jgi:hypothetical protein
LILAASMAWFPFFRRWQARRRPPDWDPEGRWTAHERVGRGLEACVIGFPVAAVLLIALGLVIE